MVINPRTRRSSNARIIPDERITSTHHARDHHKHHANTSGLPEKVNFAVKFAFPGEALLGEVAAALAALHALDVPRAVQHV